MAKKKTKLKVGKSKKKKNVLKKRLSKEDQILKNFFIGFLIVIVLIIGFYFAINQTKKFNYKGVEFEVVKFCDAKPCLLTYNTKLPVIYKGKHTFYNFYLRNDPRKLSKEVLFEGNLTLKKNAVFGITYNKSCEGDETIAVANLANLYRVAGINTASSNKTGCDLSGNVMYLNLKEGEKTSIKQIGPSCYVINIKDCEILQGTERFMVENFVEMNKLIS